MTCRKHTNHPAVGHGALGFAGTFGALPPLWVSVKRLADLEDVPGGSGAVFAPIRCRTHAYTSTNKTALIQNGWTCLFLPHFPPSSSRLTALHPYCSPYVSSVYARYTFRQLLAGVDPQLLLLPCLSLAFLPSRAGEGANVFPDEQSAGQVPDERLRLLSALPRLRRGASHLHSKQHTVHSRDFTLESEPS